MKTKTAIILAAGRGSRLDPSTGEETHFSKPLFELGGKTLLQRVTEVCRGAGIQKILVVVGFRKELLEAEVTRLNQGDMATVHNAAWQKQNGLSLYVCQEEVQENFLLLMCDHVFDPTILNDMAEQTVMPGEVLLAVDRRVDAIFDLDDATKVWEEEGKIQRIGKQLAEYNAIDCGIFHCSPGIFSALEASMVDGDCSLSDGMAILSSQGTFKCYDIGDRWWQDVDTPEMLGEAARLLKARAD